MLIQMENMYLPIRPGKFMMRVPMSLLRIVLPDFLYQVHTTII